MMMNSKFDINCYQEVSNIVGYDGFIDPNGFFYKVKKKYSNDINVSHLTWSEYYLSHDMDRLRSLLNPSYNTICILSKLSSKQDILIHFFGFVYYSHDYLTHEPIIIPPDPIYNNKIINSEQLDTLYEIMNNNLEQPLNHEIFSQSDYYKRYR